MKYLQFQVVAWLLIFLWTSTSLATLPQLDSLISAAISSDPAIKLLQKKKQMMELRIPQNSNLPDPAVSMGLMNMPVNSFTFDQEPMTVKSISLSQAFPFPGKLSTREKIDLLNADRVALEIIDKKNQIRQELTTLYYHWAYNQKAIQIIDLNLHLLQQIQDVVRSRYIVGNAAQQNILQVEMEMNKLRDMRQDYSLRFEENKEAIQIYLDDHSSLSLSESVLNDIPAFQLVQDTLKQLAIQNKPEFANIKILNKISRKKQSLYQYEYFPDFKLFVQYSQRDQLAVTGKQLNDLVSVKLGFTLPINYGDKKSAKVQEAKIEQKYIEQLFQNQVKKLSLSVNTLLKRLTTFQNREKIFRKNLLPQATQNYNAALSGYQVGKVDFNTVINAAQTMLDLKLRLFKTRSDYFIAYADLQYITGTPTLK